MDPIPLPNGVTEAREPRPGDRLGEFRILSLIGEGAMGKVYEARQESLQRRVALKVLPATGTGGDGQAVTRFYREARAAAHLTHPNIVPVYGFGVEQGSYYYAMEFVTGPSLHALVHARKNPLRDPSKIARYILQVSQALEVAHKEGVIHRDIKPANILVRQQEGQDQAAITDFGLARQERSKSITQAGALMGTPVYMAPEQARGEKVDHRIDIYALGVVLYECLTGKLPFAQTKLRELLIAITTLDPAPPSAMVPGLSPDLEAIALKAMQKDRAQRYADCKELSADLIRYFRGDIVEARHAGPVAQAVRQVKKHKIISTLSAAVVLLVLAWVVGNPYLMRSRTSDRAAERLEAARAKLKETLGRYREAARKLTEAREARAGELYRLGAAGRIQSERASTAVTRATLALERFEESLLLRPKSSAAGAASVAEEGRAILDEVMVLLPPDDPLAGEARELARELVGAQMRRARREGNLELAQVHHRELVALGGVAASGKAQLNLETEPPGARVFLYRVDSDESGAWSLGQGRDVGRAPLEPGPELEPGEYMVEFLAPGRLGVRVPFVVRVGQRALQIRLELPRADATPLGFLYVPPSEFMAGGDPSAVRPLFRTPQPIWIGGFFLAKREVTVAEYLEFLLSLTPESRRVPAAGQFLKTPEGGLRAPGSLFDHPVAGVTREEAEDYCAWRSRKDGRVTFRLPTAVEWEKAARGPAGRIYPWGNRFSPHGKGSRSNMQRGGPPGRANTVPCGSMRGDRSIYGVQDMGGNLSEWVDDSFGGNSDAVLRGGSWALAPEITRSASREPVSPQGFEAVAGRVGFRLAFD